MICPDYRPKLQALLSNQRRRLAEQNAQRFAQVYLRHHFSDPPSRMHTELFELLNEAVGKRRKRIAVAAPRGHAKTTVVSLAYVLWCALYKQEMYILLISATRDQAVSLLRAVREELEQNRLLLADFPEACNPPGQRPAPKPWTANNMVLPNGVALKALGAGQGVRGTKHKQHRPSLIVVDDLEDQDQIHSGEQREKLRDWFDRTLLKACAPDSNVIVVGTILHYDALLARLTSEKPQRGRGGGWTARKYRAVESWSQRPELWEKWEQIYFHDAEHAGASGPDAAQAYYRENRKHMLTGAKVLWTKRESYRSLMLMRATEGSAAFQAEKQNEPMDASVCLFREELFRYWDDDHLDVAELLQSLGSRAVFHGACDPSLGQRPGQGDYTAIITLVRDSKTDVMYVIGADIARRTPDETVERIVRLAQLYRFREFAVEANQFQKLLADQVRNRARQAGRSLQVKEVTNTANKRVRVESLEPVIAQGMLRFSKRHTLLLEQLRHFPLHAHDDGPDALEVAVSSGHGRRHKTEVIPI